MSKIAWYNGIKSNDDSSFEILYLNARSLRKEGRLDEICDFVKSRKKRIDVICITEIWIYTHETPYFNIEGFQSFFSTRDKDRGGGAAIYVNKLFDSANEIVNIDKNSNNLLIIELLKSNIKIALIYRQPNNSTDPSGSIFVDELTSHLIKQKNIFVIGDFNFDIFSTSSQIENYKDSLELIGLCFVTSKSKEFPTRIDYNNKSFTGIDHILCDFIDDPRIKKLSVSYFDLTADHKSLLLSVWLDENNNHNNTNNQSFKITNYRRIDHLKLMSNINVESFDELCMTVKEIIDKNTVELTRKREIRRPHVTDEMLRFITIKYNYERLKRKYPLDPFLHERWKFYRNKVSNLSKKNKKIHVNNYFLKNAYNPKNTHKKMNSLLGKAPKKQNESVTALIENGNKITDKTLIANIMVNSFGNVSKKIIAEIGIDQTRCLDYHNRQTVEIKNTFHCPQATEDEVIGIIQKMKNSHAIDVYGISNFFVKKYSKELTPILTKLINNSMYNSEFPSSLKFAIIKPVHKKGSKMDKGNYRPISLLPIFGKVFESAIYRRIYEHCKVNDFFNANQFGYIEKSNTESAMIHTMRDIYNSLDLRNETSLLTIDLTSAFDTINHTILLIKLKKLEFDPFFLKLLTSYITDRLQVVNIDGSLSDIFEIFSGAPQGSVLAALLFIIYVNDIFNLKTKGKMKAFCDDLSLVNSAINRNELKLAIQHDLDMIIEWLSLHHLKANANKTNYLIFEGRKRFEQFTERSLNITIKDLKIERMEYVRILGLYIDEELKFAKHIEITKSKIIPFIAKFWRIRHYLTDETAEIMYFSHVHWAFNFMNAIYNVAPNYLLETLAVIQRRALRIVYRKERLSHNSELFSQRILPLDKICVFRLVLTLFKMSSFLMKNNIRIMCVNEVHNYPTRNNFKYAIEYPATSYGRMDFYYRAASEFNSLPESVTKFKTLGVFKKRLKEHLFDTFKLSNR